MATMKEIYSQIGSNLENNTAKNKGINGVFQFDISGDDPMNFHFKLADGAATISEGSTDTSNIAISMADSDFKKMVDGELNGMMATMTGKLKIKGDMSLAMKLESIIG